MIPATTQAPPAPTGQKPASAAALLGGVKLGAASRKTTSGKTYPVLPETANTAEIVSRIIDHKEQFDHLEASLKVDKADLTSSALGCWFQTQAGKSDPASSVECRNSETGETVLVQFQNRYAEADIEAVLAIVGEEKLVEHFEQVFELKIDGRKLPGDPEVRQQVVDEITAVLTRHHAGEAVSSIVKVKPKPAFHVVRHTELTPDQNARLQSACPIITMVKTKGTQRKAA